VAAALVVAAACSPPGSGAENSIVIYSNSISDGRGDWLTKQAREAGFELQLVDLGGGDVTNRLLAERNAPVADVVMGLNDVYFQRLKGADVLESYTPTWSDLVDPALGDSRDGTYWPIVREPIMLVSNDAAFTGSVSAPQDWPDLWTRDDLRGRYEVPSSLGGATSQLVLAGILARYLDPAGELGVSAQGWQQIQRYFANGSPSVQGTDLYARMAAGEVVAGQMWLTGKTSREAEYGLSTSPARPSIGVPMAVQHVGIVAGTDRIGTAQDFVDWFGSASVQAAWSREFSTMPTNQDALADADPAALELTDSFATQEIDWQVVTRNLDAWIEKIELEYL
jgi:iron(III) transport system substrate-binding protein